MNTSHRLFNLVHNRVDHFSPKLDLDFGASWADVGWYGDPTNNFQIYRPIKKKLQASFSLYMGKFPKIYFGPFWLEWPKVNASEPHFYCSFQGYPTWHVHRTQPNSLIDKYLANLAIWPFGCMIKTMYIYRHFFHVVQLMIFVQTCLNCWSWKQSCFALIHKAIFNI